jgi:pimeloyl-ACP methyl ester carboxylesterase
MITPDIVLIGGAGEDADIWADVLELIDDRARVHTLPGHAGDAADPLGTIDEMAADLLAGLRGPTVLVGHSMGGAVALAAAVADGDLVAGVVAVASGARLPVNPQLLASLPGAFESALPFVLSASTGGREAVPEERASIAARMEAMLRRAGPTVFTTDLRACDGYDVRSSIAVLQVPLLVLVGADDRMTPVRLAEELSAAPRATLRVLPEVAHQVPWEAPGAVVEAVEQFAESIAGD